MHAAQRLTNFWYWEVFDADSEGGQGCIRNQRKFSSRFLLVKAKELVQTEQQESKEITDSVNSVDSASPTSRKLLQSTAMIAAITAATAASVNNSSLDEDVDIPPWLLWVMWVILGIFVGIPVLAIVLFILSLVIVKIDECIRECQQRRRAQREQRQREHQRQSVREQAQQSQSTQRQNSPQRTASLENSQNFTGSESYSETSAIPAGPSVGERMDLCLGYVYSILVMVYIYICVCNLPSMIEPIGSANHHEAAVVITLLVSSYFSSAQYNRGTVDTSTVLPDPVTILQERIHHKGEAC